MPASSQVDVVGVGLNATDPLLPVHQFPAAGSKIELRSANVLPGGQGATAMVACQSWDLRTRRDMPGRISGDSDLRQSLPAVRAKYNARLTAATLGPEGVLAYDGAQFHYAPAFRIEAVDTTGAGDIFHAGFIYGLLQAWPLPRQLEFACAAAALNCTGIGARGHIAPLAEIEHLIATGPRHPSAFQLESGTASS